MSSPLDALPLDASAVILSELEHRDPALLAELRSAQELSPEHRGAVERVLAAAVINSMGADWNPNEHGLAVERAIDAFVDAFPIAGN